MPQTPAQKAAQKKWQAKNKDKLAAYAKAWRARNPGHTAAYMRNWLAKPENAKRHAANIRRYQLDNPHAQRRFQYQAKYGITIEQYDALFVAQNGVCAICSRPPGKRRLAVDHCHTTKAVRGLLCVKCNTAIGKLNDDPELLRRAIAYLFFYQ